MEKLEAITTTLDVVVKAIEKIEIAIMRGIYPVYKIRFKKATIDEMLSMVKEADEKLDSIRQILTVQKKKRKVINK